MGNNNQKQLPDSPLINQFNHQEWQFKQQLHYSQLFYNNVLKINSECYYVPLRTVEQEIQKYQARRPGNILSQHLVWVYFISNDDYPNLKSRPGMLKVFTERIPIRLNQIKGLNSKQFLIVLKDVYEGYNATSSYYGPTIPTDRCIGFNENGKTKIWINDNFSLNFPNEQPNYQMLSSQQKIKQCTAIIYNMVESKCETVNHELRKLFQTQNPNFIEAISIIDKYTYYHNIKIPTFINKNHIIKPISIPLYQQRIPSSPIENNLYHTSTTRTPIHINQNNFYPSKIKRVSSFGELNTNNNQIEKYTPPFNLIKKQSSVSQRNTVNSVSKHQIQTNIPLLYQPTSNTFNRAQQNINLQYFKSNKNNINLINSTPTNHPFELNQQYKSLNTQSTYRSPKQNDILTISQNKYITQRNTHEKVYSNKIPQIGDKSNKIFDKILEQEKNRINIIEKIDKADNENKIQQIKQSITSQDKALLVMEEQIKQKNEEKITNQIKIENIQQSSSKQKKQTQKIEQKIQQKIQQKPEQKEKNLGVLKRSSFIKSNKPLNQSSSKKKIQFNLQHQPNTKTQERDYQNSSLQTTNKQQTYQKYQSKYKNQYQKQSVKIQQSLKSNDKKMERVPGKIQKISHDATHQDIQSYIRQKYLKYIHPEEKPSPKEQPQIPSQKISQYKQYIQNQYNKQVKNSKLQTQNKQNSKQTEQKDFGTRNTFTFMPKERQNDLDVLQLQRTLDKKFKNVQTSKNNKQGVKSCKKSNIKDDQSDDTLNIAQLEQNLIKFEQSRVKSTVKDNQQIMFNEKKYLSTVDDNKKQIINIERNNYFDYDWKKNTKIPVYNQKEFGQKYNLESYKKVSSSIDQKYRKYILGKKNIKDKSKQQKSSPIYQIQQEEYQKQTKDNKYYPQYQKQIKGFRSSRVQKNISYDDLRNFLWK